MAKFTHIYISDIFGGESYLFHEDDFDEMEDQFAEAFGENNFDRDGFEIGMRDEAGNEVFRSIEEEYELGEHVLVIEIPFDKDGCSSDEARFNVVWRDGVFGKIFSHIEPVGQINRQVTVRDGHYVRETTRGKFVYKIVPSLERSMIAYHESTDALKKLESYTKVGNYFVSDCSLQLVWDAIGLESYDHSLPKTFFDAYIEEHGKRPYGVWCYDENMFGEFYPLEKALEKLGGIIQGVEHKEEK